MSCDETVSPKELESCSLEVLKRDVHDSLIQCADENRESVIVKDHQTVALSASHFPHRSRTGEKTFTCSICSTVLSHKSALNTHMRVHTGEKPFTCSTCGKAFSHKQVFQTHLRIHTGEKPFLCSICAKSFSKSVNLKRHLMNIHRGEKSPTTTVSSLNGKTISHKIGLKTLAKIQATGRSCTCSTCGKIFYSSSDLKRHQRVHTGEKPFKCSFCAKAFSNSGHLIRHKRNHTRDQPYACSICAKTFTESSRLINHMRIHTKEKSLITRAMHDNIVSQNVASKSKSYGKSRIEGKHFTCSTCSEIFDKSSDLVRHQVIHNDSSSRLGAHSDFNLKTKREITEQKDEKPFICSICNKSFTHRSQILRHMKIHTERKPYTCSICSKQFYRSNDLKRHHRIHTGEKPFICSVCAKAFTNSGHLIRHIRIHTRGETKEITEQREIPSTDSSHQRKYKSHKEDPRSSFELNNSKTLMFPPGQEPTVTQTLNKRREITEQKREKSFTCPTCAKTFSESRNLKNHIIRIHTGEKPSTFPVCPDTFSESESLKKNIMQIHAHPQEKLFICSICTKAFSHSVHLIRHMRTHTGEKPFTCSSCPKAFANNGNLKKHVMRMHAEGNNAQGTEQF